jgi:Leucine-rich repeat (LRR) protein
MSISAYLRRWWYRGYHERLSRRLASMSGPPVIIPNQELWPRTREEARNLRPEIAYILAKDQICLALKNRHRELYFGSEPDRDSISPLAALNRLPPEIAELGHLEGLSLVGSHVRDLTPIAGLKNLKWLHQRSDAGIDDLAPIGGLTNLTSLDVGSTSIVDLTPIAGLAALTEVNLNIPRLIDLSPMANLKSLRKLNLVGSHSVSDLSSIAELTNLRELTLAGTSVTNLKPLAGLKALEVLHLGITKLEDLGPLAGLSKLEVLTLSGAPVSDLTPLSELFRLRHLNLGGTLVEDLSPLAGLIHLAEAAASNERPDGNSPGLFFSNTPVAIRPPFNGWLEYSAKATNTVATINYLRSQQGLKPVVVGDMNC